MNNCAADGGSQMPPFMREFVARRSNRNLATSTFLQDRPQALSSMSPFNPNEPAPFKRQQSSPTVLGGGAKTPPPRPHSAIFGQGSAGGGGATSQGADKVRPSSVVFAGGGPSITSPPLEQSGQSFNQNHQRRKSDFVARYMSNLSLKGTAFKYKNLRVQFPLICYVSIN